MGLFFDPTCRVAVQLALSAYDSSQLQAGTEECYSLHLLCVQSVTAKLDILPSRTVIGVRPSVPFSAALFASIETISQPKNDKRNNKKIKPKKAIKNSYVQISIKSLSAVHEKGD